MMLQRIKLMPDYSCYSLWDRDDGGDIEPWELPLSEEIIKRLLHWQDISAFLCDILNYIIDLREDFSWLV